MFIVVIYGPPGSGKTQNAAKLVDLFKCEFSVDPYTPGEALRPYGLYLLQTVNLQTILEALVQADIPAFFCSIEQALRD